MIIPTFDVADWFWIVAGDTSRAWSSKAGRYVDAWPHDRQTRIASEAELTEVLLPRGLAGPVATTAQVRSECARRMMALVGARDAEHMAVIISNGVREQGRLQAILTGIPGLLDGREWTAEETARAAALWTADAAIEAIRAASNAMEADPPADFADDRHWPYMGGGAP